MAGAPRGDIAGLARAMTDLASDPQQTARLGRQARVFVSQKFRKQTHVRQLMDIYERALQNDHSKVRKEFL